MRKWMRDRLKRRKKNEQTSAGEPAQAPLQPAYFEGPEEPQEQQAPATESQPAIEASPGVAETSASEDQSASPASPQPGKRRRRRGRGGRGRPRGKEPKAEAKQATPEPPPTENEQPQPKAVPAVARPPKGQVILAIGLPGSGKSSWFKRHNITPLSSDTLRALLFDDPHEQRFQDLVFSNLRSMLKARLIARRPMNYVDATNLTPQERHSWIKLAKDYGYEVHAVFFDVPLEVCLERNQKRRRTVEDEAMRRMWGKLRPPKFEEGFAKITVVRVKKKESEVTS
jgi:predicted kinase